MTKTELVAAISEKSGVAKADVEKVLKGFEDEVSGVVSAGKEKLTLPGFLSFERTRRAARTGRKRADPARAGLPHRHPTV